MLRRHVAWLVLCATLHPSAAIAKTFYPKTLADLKQSVAVAGVNLENDTIDLGDLTFSLSQQLIVEPDSGNGVVIHNGVLERAGSMRSSRLLWFKSVPKISRNKNEPVHIFNMSFKNGLVEAENSSINADGGGAILTERHTIIEDAEFLNNTVAGNVSGGAILAFDALEISNSIFLNNRALHITSTQFSYGGAIAMKPGSSLYLSYVYFVGNRASSGAAIYASRDMQTLSILGSSFDNNSAELFGGGIWAGEGYQSLNISNSTFVNNNARGGSAMSLSTADVDAEINHVTLWANRTSHDENGAFHVDKSGEAHAILRNSLLVRNSGHNCSSKNSGIAIGTDEGVVIEEQHYNSVDDISCGGAALAMAPTPSRQIFDGPLSYNGGVVPSLPLKDGSSAVDKIPIEYCLGFDTRGVLRPDNGALDVTSCDAGAFELVSDRTDSDNDAVRDTIDNCANRMNPLQSDVDEDGKGDECDAWDNRDSDNDFVANYLDNCPMVANFVQMDSNHNGIGDACDEEAD